MKIVYPTYEGNYPEQTRKITKQYISYRGKINTQKINAQYLNYQYESTLERDFISILVHDQYCHEIIPQAIFTVPDEKGKFHKYSVDIWSLYYLNKRWIIYLFEVKPKSILEKLNEKEESWKIRLEGLKQHCASMNKYLLEKRLNVEWKFKVIIENDIYTVRFYNINNFIQDSLRYYDNSFIDNLLGILDDIFKNSRQIIYLDLINQINLKLAKSGKYSLIIIKNAVNYFIYNQLLWIDWERDFNESSSLISYNKSKLILLRPSYDIIPVFYALEEYKPKIVLADIDLDKIDKKLIEEAKDKLEIIKPLLERYTNKQLKRKEVEIYAKKFDVSTVTLYKWINKYLDSKRDFRTLIKKDHRKGNYKSKLNARVEEIIQNHINNLCDCCKILSPKMQYYENIKNDCENNNLKAPNIKTIRKRISELPAKERKGKQGGLIKYEIQKTIVSEIKRGEFPLHFVQVDSTWLDLFVIDEFNKKTTRPFLTIYIDIQTRMIYSYWITLREHNAVDVNRGLMRGILPKDDLMKENNIIASFPIYGIPYRIQFDNGKIFDTEYVQDFCFKYGVVDYQFRMVKRPDTGGFVERLLGTINKSWLSNLDGYAPPVKNRPPEYDPQKHKNLFLFNDFKKWFLKRIIEYHNTPHEGLFRDTGMKLSPLTMYLTEMKGREPMLPKDYKQMNIDVLHFKKSVLNAEGIKFYHNNYNNDGVNSTGKRNNFLAKIRTSGRGEKKKILWRYDPEDIREIWVYNELAEKPFYFSVKFSTGLLKLFMQEHPDIPIPLRVYNSIRKRLKLEGEKKEKNSRIIANRLKQSLGDNKESNSKLNNINSDKSQKKIKKRNYKSKDQEIDWDKIKPLESWKMK